MRLVRVEIKNFRGLRDVTVDLDETTVFIGENNVGKTSLLEAIRLCLTQAPNRRGDTFDDYDHHLDSGTAEFGDAGETTIVLHFAETTADEWPEEVVQALSDVIGLDGGLNKVTLRVRSSRQDGTGELAPTWEFLDAKGNALRAKRVPTVLRDLQQLKPFFYLSAMRDATREFQPRSPFWGPFLRNPAIPADVLEQLETDLTELNDKVIAADARLKGVRERIQKTSEIVSIGKTDSISIEAVPGRARDLLSRAQVAISGQTGARLPVTRHGAGTQSLAVLFLFESFLSSMLEDIYGPGSAPIVAMEEPEAHLHPAAIRALWTTIKAIPGQKLVATHSGDLLARVPLANLRRLCHVNGQVTVRRLDPATLDAEAARKIAFHVRATRGELLFARCWLLVEGESEVWLFEGVADVLGIDLERVGVRIVPYAQVGASPFIRLADDLGIAWFCFADGDDGGTNHTRAARTLLNGRPEAERIGVTLEKDIETHLCSNGFTPVFEASISLQKVRANPIQSAKGTPEYIKELLAVQEGSRNSGKPGRIVRVVEDMRNRGASSVPAALKAVVDAVVKLAGGQ